MTAKPIKPIDISPDSSEPPSNKISRDVVREREVERTRTDVIETRPVSREPFRKITLANSEKDDSEVGKLGLRAWRKTYANRRKA